MSAQPALQPPLLSPQTAAPQRPRHDKATSAKSLWLCAWFPDLPLQAAGCEARGAKAVAIFEDRGARRTVYMASAAASAAGVAPGMWLSQAHALCPALKTQTRNVAAEMASLSRLAARAGRFTPTVSLQPPQALLLEIAGSLRLFGGLASLKRKLMEGLSRENIDSLIAVAPTPLASLLFAAQGQAITIIDRAALRSALGKLPVTALQLETELTRRLVKTGVRDLHDLWRLPRAGLARRFGIDFIRYLDRVLGVALDPRASFRAPPRFSAELELPAEVADQDLLRGAAQRLLARLCRFLRIRDAGTTALSLDLHHQHLPPSRLEIGLRHASRDETHLLELLAEHLDRFKLPAPVIKLGLLSEAIQPFSARTLRLFATQGAPTESGYDGDNWPRLLERLQARLGREAVRGIKVLADHRPEWAWDGTELDDQSGCATNNRRRPLWLLPDPQPLVLRQGRPWRCGPITISEGPERLEGGWWDNRDISRDYYMAKDTDGSRLWVFRDLYRDRWFLHGLFG
jgi:protein ImuB